MKIQMIDQADEIEAPQIIAADHLTRIQIILIHHHQDTGEEGDHMKRGPKEKKKNSKLIYLRRRLKKPK